MVKLTIGWNRDIVEIPDGSSIEDLIKLSPSFVEGIVEQVDEGIWSLDDPMPALNAHFLGEYRKCSIYGIIVLIDGKCFDEESRWNYTPSYRPKHGENVRVWANGAYVVGSTSASCYGGPEEGGWWYTEEDNHFVIRCREYDEAEEMMRHMQELKDELQWSIVPEMPPFHTPTHRPHYE